MDTASGRPSLRSRVGRTLRDVRWLAGLAGLRPAVVAFQWRARRLARRLDDRFSLTSVTRPADLRILLQLAEGRRRVVELGTATGWTAITLALDDPDREVISFDPFERPEPARYLQLVSEPVRARVELILAPGATGPRSPAPVDMLYIDSSHERQDTIDEVLAWRDHLAPGALIVFDDYTNPNFPGVREAIDHLQLAGSQRGTLFVHESCP